MFINTNNYLKSWENKHFIISGQRSQAVGMGLELYNNFEIVKKIFMIADEKLNYPISKIILEDQLINYSLPKTLSQQS